MRLPFYLEGALQGVLGAGLGLLILALLLPHALAAPALGNWDEHLIDTELGGVDTTHAVDVNADGRLDVVVAAQGTDRISWFENPGADYTNVTRIFFFGS